MGTEANLFGVEAKAKRAKAKPAPAGEVQAVIGQWAALFQARFGEKPLVTGKDGAAVKRLVAHGGLPAVLRRLPIYLDLPDEFLAGQGYPLSLMLGQWNRLVALDRPAQDRGRVPDADRTSARMARLRSQGGA
ncbi:MAG: hypothetical protein V4597_08420 [Pseudomonadota bacterium]